MNAKLSTLNQSFGYKTVIVEDGHPVTRCFFRFLAGAWHDVKAPHDFGHTEAEVLEVIEHELNFGSGLSGLGSGEERIAELIIFGCCCARCASRPELKAAARAMAAQGFNVSHGYWPEHVAAENARLESEMCGAAPA
jgi:hypothetical protein